MSKWALRLALLETASHRQVTDETDETGVVSVLSVPDEGEPPDLAPGAEPGSALGPVGIAVQRLGAEARELLECLLWIDADTGALTEREIARALRWQLGAVFNGIKALAAVGAVVRQGIGWAPSKRLQLEFRHLPPPQIH